MSDLTQEERFVKIAGAINLFKQTMADIDRRKKEAREGKTIVVEREMCSVCKEKPEEYRYCVRSSRGHGTKPFCRDCYVAQTPKCVICGKRNGEQDCGGCSQSVDGVEVFECFDCVPHPRNKNDKKK